MLLVNYISPLNLTDFMGGLSCLEIEREERVLKPTTYHSKEIENLLDFMVGEEVLTDITSKLTSNGLHGDLKENTSRKFKYSPAKLDPFLKGLFDDLYKIADEQIAAIKEGADSEVLAAVETLDYIQTCARILGNRVDEFDFVIELPTRNKETQGWHNYAAWNFNNRAEELNDVVNTNLAGKVKTLFAASREDRKELVRQSLRMIQVLNEAELNNLDPNTTKNVTFFDTVDQMLMPYSNNSFHKMAPTYAEDHCDYPDLGYVLMYTAGGAVAGAALALVISSGPTTFPDIAQFLAPAAAAVTTAYATVKRGIHSFFHRRQYKELLAAQNHSMGLEGDEKCSSPEELMDALVSKVKTFFTDRPQNQFSSLKEITYIAFPNITTIAEFDHVERYVHSAINRIAEEDPDHIVETGQLFPKTVYRLVSNEDMREQRSQLLGTLTHRPN
jgi:hypothetical protein